VMRAAPACRRILALGFATATVFQLFSRCWLDVLVFSARLYTEPGRADRLSGSSRTFSSLHRRNRGTCWTCAQADDSRSSLAPKDEDLDQSPELQEDWRQFRAKLVLSEGKGGVGAKAGAASTQGWAHATPLVEKGSLLLSTPNDFFSLSQQYFHKAVILILTHSETGDMGVILNRPTAFSTKDIEVPQLDMPWNGFIKGLQAMGVPSDFLPDGSQEGWNIWCGGDCQGLTSPPDERQYFCLHTLAEIGQPHQEVIKGVFQVELEEARNLVLMGKADKDDFLVLAGYCGWGRGQLQAELDRGESWTLAAADSRFVLGKLRQDQRMLNVRLNIARKSKSMGAGGAKITAQHIGDGCDRWQELYEGLGEECARPLSEFVSTTSEVHADEMLRHWIGRILSPSRSVKTASSGQALRSASGQSTDTSASAARQVPPMQLRAGVLLRGSKSMWVLGKPAESELFHRRNPVPGHYLHKAVLMLLRDVQRGSPSVLVLLNGPKIGELHTGEEVLFGGIEALNEPGIFQVANSPLRVRGFIKLEGGVLEELVSLGALEAIASLNSQLLQQPDPWLQRWRESTKR